MSLFKKFILPLVLFSLAFISCEKEQSTENGGLSGIGGSSSGTAVYTLEGQPGACVTPVINGTYTDGIALDITNSVIISANVTSVGTYTISTGLLNGVRFSASGTFTTTGAQAITLLGSGTPINPTVNTYVPGTNGCSFTITTVAGGTNFLKCKIDGVQYNFDQSIYVMRKAPDTLSIGGIIGATFETLAVDVIGTLTPPAGVYEEEGINTSSPAFVTAAFLDEDFNIFAVDINTPDASVPRTHRFKVTITGITGTRITGTFSGGVFDTFGSAPEKVITEGSFDLPLL